MFDNISKLMKTALEQKKLTQAELARSLGFKNSQFISNVVRGKCSLPLKRMKHFSYLTDTSIDEIKTAYLLDAAARFDEATK